MSPLPRLAALCCYLRLTIDLARRENERVVALCSHVVREGSDCVGPFLEEATTACGLWEPRARVEEGSRLDRVRLGRNAED